MGYLDYIRRCATMTCEDYIRYGNGYGYGKQGGEGERVEAIEGRSIQHGQSIRQ